MTAYLCAKAINSTIKNCKIIDSNIQTLSGTNRFYFGSLVAYAKNCCIDKCYSNSMLGKRNNSAYSYSEDDIYVGGLVGYILGTEQNYSQISNSYCENGLSINKDYNFNLNLNANFSGFIGYAKYCNVTNSYSTSSLYVRLEIHDNALIKVGGIVAKGENCNIINCFSTGDYQYDGANGVVRYQGGYALVGELSNKSTMKNCYSLTKLLDIDKKYTTVLTDCVANTTCQQIYENIKNLWDTEIWSFSTNSPPVFKEE